MDRYDPTLWLTPEEVQVEKQATRFLRTGGLGEEFPPKRTKRRKIPTSAWVRTALSVLRRLVSKCKNCCWSPSIVILGVESSAAA